MTVDVAPLSVLAAWALLLFFNASAPEVASDKLEREPIRDWGQIPMKFTFGTGQDNALIAVSSPYECRDQGNIDNSLHDYVNSPYSFEFVICL